MTESCDEADPVSDLLRRGEHLQAARLCERRGEVRRAIQIYERIWRFADALPLALAAGDQPLAVRLALDARDLSSATEIAARLPADAPEALKSAADAFASRGRPFEAGRLRERAGDLSKAAQDYLRSGALLDAARALELGGQIHRAGQIYEQICRGEGSEAELPLAQLALGRLLGRMGRHEDAARHLQRAARHDGVRLAALRVLCLTLHSMGLRTAAIEVLRQARRMAPELPASPEELAAGERTVAVENASELLRGRFKVRRLVGSGANGRVYHSDDLLLGRPVAVKLLSVGAGGSGAEQQAYRRFLREAEAAARLKHPGIVTVYEVDDSQGMLVMELMAETLADRLGTGQALAPAQVRQTALQILSALELAHSRGIIHRDLKPANIFFDHAGNAKVGDFGAAHLLDFGQTQTGGFVGTVAYMSPEQISDAGVSPATDLYALGVTLFEALTGRRPFPGPDLVEQHLSEPPPAATSVNRGLTAAHDDTLSRALAKAPAERFSSAAEMAASVRAWPEGGAAVLAPPAPDTAQPAPTPAASVPRHAPGVSRTLDPRVGRFVIVDQREHPIDPDELQRLRRLAAAGGPHVQRVLAVSDDLTAITYEEIADPTVPVQELSSPERAQLATAYASLENAGLGAEEMPTRAARGPYGPVLVVVGQHASEQAHARRLT